MSKLTLRTKRSRSRSKRSTPSPNREPSEGICKLYDLRNILMNNQ